MKNQIHIDKALAYLSNQFERVVFLDEVANHSHLSPGRFLHFFKEGTGIKSLPLLELSKIMVYYLDQVLSFY